MILTELASQHALMEPPIACPQYRPAVTRELGNYTQAWRHQIPRVLLAEASDAVLCVTPGEVNRPEILTDGAAVVEPYAGIDCQPLSYRYSVGNKQGFSDELAAADRRSDWIFQL